MVSALSLIWRTAEANVSAEIELRVPPGEENEPIEGERRRTRRFAITLPVRITHAQLGNITGATRDVSFSGAYFYIESNSWKEGSSIDYLLQLPSEITLGDQLTVLYSGNVVRVEKLNGKIVGIAVKIASCTPLGEQ